MDRSGNGRKADRRLDVHDITVMLVLQGISPEERIVVSFHQPQEEYSSNRVGAE